MRNHENFNGIMTCLLVFALFLNAKSAFSLEKRLAKRAV